MIKIVVSIFAVFAISRIFIQVRQNSISLRQFVFWMLIWLIVLGILYWPNFTTRIAEAVGISRGIDVFVYLGIVALFYLSFRTLIKIEEMEREITLLTRELSLRDFRKRFLRKKL